MLLAAPSTSSPRDSPLTRVGEGPADRVLLVGNGVLHGWGVPLRGMTVPGHLARLLHEQTGRAVVVDFVGEERMNAASALRWLGDAGTRGHDVAVVAVGLNDALRMTALPVWRTQIIDLVDRIRADQDTGAEVILVGLPHVRSFTMADSVMGSLAQRNADQMDPVLRQIAADRDGVTFVAAPQERFEPDMPLGSSSMYRSWAEQLLPAVLPVLEAVRVVKQVAPARSVAWDWSGTPVALESDGTEAQARLDALTEVVRERYGVAMAGVHVIDGGQVYSIAGRSGGPRLMPRSLAYCDRTVTTDAPTLIADASEDAEFAGNPFLDLVGLPFYAGVPLHALDGRAVGTLCVLDAAPRDDIDPDDLRQFVGAAEASLHSFETGVPLTVAPTTSPPEAVTPRPQNTAADPVGLRLLAVVLRPLLHSLLSRFLRKQARPNWDTRAITTGNRQRPLRVLVFGAGFAVGYGSNGTDDPLPAHLSNALSAATGRGVIVETRARPSIPLEHSLDLLGAAGAAGFDHIIWSPTLEEATRGSSRRWTNELQRIITAVRASGAPHQTLTLLGLPLVNGDHILQKVSRVLGRQVNGRIQQAASTDSQTTYLPVPNRTLPTYDTPMFDTAYRSEVTTLLIRHLTNNQTVRAADTRVTAVPALQAQRV